jgi:uncharacterized delta-60 repeat protein
MTGRLALAGALVLTLLSAPAASAAPGDPDLAWGDHAKRSFIYKDYPDTNAYGVRDTLRTASGRYVSVVNGSQGAPDYPADLRLIGLTAEGSRDATFGTNGLAFAWATQTGLNPSAIVELADQDLLVVAQSDPTYSSNHALYRFDSNGSVDTTYGTNGRVILDPADFPDPPVPNPDNAQIAIAGMVLSGASLLVTGYRADYTQGSGMSIVYFIGRIDLNGNPVTSYGTGGFVSLTGEHNPAYTPMAHDPVTGHTVLVAGRLGSGEQGPQFSILRLDAGGDPAAGWGTEGVALIDSGGPYADPGAVKIAPDGKVVITGAMNNETVVLRTTTTGARDAGFTAPGIATQGGYAADVDVTDDGSVLVLQGEGGGDWSLYRFSPTGAQAFKSTISNTTGTGSQPTEGFIAGDRYVAVGHAANGAAGILYYVANAWKLTNRLDPPMTVSQAPALGPASTVFPGDTLTVTPGSYTPAPDSRHYRWERCDSGFADAVCTVVQAASASATYTVKAGDVSPPGESRWLVAVEIATNTAGSAEHRTSAVRVLEPTNGGGNTNPPSPFTNPHISPDGTSFRVPVGSVLTVDSLGTWSGDPAVTHSWRRCTSPTPSACTTQLFPDDPMRYTVRAADYGCWVGILVEAINNYGTHTAGDFRRIAPDENQLTCGATPPGDGGGTTPGGTTPGGTTPGGTTPGGTSPGGSGGGLTGGTTFGGLPVAQSPSTCAQKAAAIFSPAKPGACAYAATEPGTLTATLTASLPAGASRAVAAAKKKPLKLGGAKVVFTKPGVAVLKLKLTAKGKKALKKTKKAKVTLTITFTPKTGKATRAKKTFRLK